MKNLLIIPLLWCAGATLFANPVSDNPVFKSLIGNWEGAGELVNSEDQSITLIKETWSAELDESGIFKIAGKRMFGQEEHDFAWEFFSNRDIIEGQMKISNPEVDIRFEAQINDAERSVTLKIPLSGGGGIMTIVNTLSEDGLSIEGTVEIVDETGKTTTTGKVTHKKI